MKSTLIALIACATALGAQMLPFAAHAQSTAGYPSKPVRIIVGFPPGSATDVAARRVAQQLTVQMGQSFVVENRPGASGSLAADTVARAAPDGYTLYAGTTSEIAINRPGGMKVRYDPEKDFIPTALLFTTNAVLLASNASGFNSAKDLVATAKAKPATVNIAAVNAFQQVVLSSFARSADVKLNIIYYKGTALAMNDLMGGQIDAMVGYPAESMAAVVSGKARALAIVGSKRNEFMTDTPTTSDIGIPVPELVVWGAVFAPTGTPMPIVEALNREIVAANNHPDIKAALAKAGSNSASYNLPQFQQFVTSEIAKWDRLVKESGIKLE